MRNALEPPHTVAFREGFLWLPTVGMRLAPEILVLELFREAYFSSSGGARSLSDPRAQAFDPDRPELASYFNRIEAQAAAYSLRGRGKERSLDSFYAPAYPILAGMGWFRKQTDRAVREIFLSGAIGSGCALGGGVLAMFMMTSPEVVPPYG